MSPELGEWGWGNGVFLTRQGPRELSYLSKDPDAYLSSSSLVYSFSFRFFKKYYLLSCFT